MSSNVHQEVPAAGTADPPVPALITRQFRLPLLFGGSDGLGLREVDVTLGLDPVTLTVTSFHLQFHKRGS
jgi:hypothetical protein